MDTSTDYTTEGLGNMSPIYPSSLMTIEAKVDINSSVGTVLPSVPLGWRFLFDAFLVYTDSFIGMLEPGEADRMKEEVALYKKRFNDAFARKHKILFGE